MLDFSKIISQRLGITEKQIANTIILLEQGATIPFISRYRKEITDSLDEEQITAIRDELNKLKELEKRRETVLKTIEEQGNMTPELKEKIENCENSTELEDIYLPFKPKKKTRASVAKEKGLEPLAVIIMNQRETKLQQKAEEFVNDQVPGIKDALQGARDIIAEWISENQEARNIVRRFFSRSAVITSKLVKGKEQEGIKYSDYYEFSEPLNRCPSHRMLAMRRGEQEDILRISIDIEEEKVMETLTRKFVQGNLEVSKQMETAVKDSYKRLLQPSIENEFKALHKEKADEEAIKVFAENLRQLLLSPPLGQKNVLALDPGYRTGCKVVCLDRQGNLLHNETIYPHPPQNDRAGSAKKISTLIESYKIEAIAIGNGTASRETEYFIKALRFTSEVKVFVVSEAGASIYSASKTARDEFPEYDVTVRGAVSIGRRLMDPLAELVKIEPKSIGVGQYQHDVDQNKLKENLDLVVESCVNVVGVSLNTASLHLLTYVSGLGPSLAKNITDFRKQNGPFRSRGELRKVPRMGDKAFEQCAGFLRIDDAENPLDNSAVHPESYYVVEKIAADLNCNVSELIKYEEIRSKVDIKRYISPTVGLPTLKDIMDELAKPGRDPRTKIEIFEFSPDVFTVNDLKPGMVLPGIVTNITNFGAFVDIGVKQDGLIHISNMADKFIKHPSDVVKLNQKLSVKVIDVDVARKRIQLSLKQNIQSEP